MLGAGCCCCWLAFNVALSLTAIWPRTKSGGGTVCLSRQSSFPGSSPPTRALFLVKTGAGQSIYPARLHGAPPPPPTHSVAALRVVSSVFFAVFFSPAVTSPLANPMVQASPLLSQDGAFSALMLQGCPSTPADSSPAGPSYPFHSGPGRGGLRCGE